MRIDSTGSSRLQSLPFEVKQKIALYTDGNARDMLALERILWPKLPGAKAPWEGNPSLWNTLAAGLRGPRTSLPVRAHASHRVPHVFNSGTEMDDLVDACFKESRCMLHQLAHLEAFAPRSPLTAQLARIHRDVGLVARHGTLLSAQAPDPDRFYLCPNPDTAQWYVLFTDPLDESARQTNAPGRNRRAKDLVQRAQSLGRRLVLKIKNRTNIHKSTS
jgi:hypothetical protein